MVKIERRRKLTPRELASVTSSRPVVRRVQSGRAGQLAPEGPERQRDFARRLTDDTQASEGSTPA